ncbi:hypothetical protein SAMN02745687_02392 [Lachnospiraceae bacterium NK3A20]|nr:hypothetical protein SAMN02745687_02392 [Lachnospiraceae bacterium NK3A20]
MMDFSRFRLSFNDAKNIINSYDEMNDTQFFDQIRHWANYDVPEENYGAEYKPFREAVVDEFQASLADSGNRINYDLDLRVGIRLYELLSPAKDFTVINANDDDIWRYISVNVMPDITFIRYPNLSEDVKILREYIPDLSYSIAIKTEKDSIRMKKKRFYSHTRRIWLKTLWWYIHLGWQGNSEKTYEVLKNNGTNIISHFIERPGRGYREQLFRCMLYAYSLLPEQKDSTFRAAAKLNLAKCVSLEPALTEGGEAEYSKELFDEVYDREATKQDAEEDDTE